MPLPDRLKNTKVPKTKRDTPLWQGPEVDGITFSLLSRFLVCRERFRLLVVEGLKPAGGWSHKVGYGNLWHLCEEVYAAGSDWRGALLGYAQQLCQQYPTQMAAIMHWHGVCRAQFPVYIKHWSDHHEVPERSEVPDVANKTPLLQEQVFNVPYKLPSGRVVRLRGKFDSVDLVVRDGSRAIWLQENKTKGDIKEERLARQLTFDLQTMLYLIALEEFKPTLDKSYSSLPIAGVRYNVIRRPLSGGRHSITQHKGTKNKPAETSAAFYERLGGLIAEDPTYFFMRWRVDITKGDVAKFKQRCFNPILESLCDWWQHIRASTGGNPFELNYSNGAGHHWQHPFGVFNSLDELGYSDLDEYMLTGSEAGLERTENLYPELSE